MAESGQYGIGAELALRGEGSAGAGGRQRAANTNSDSDEEEAVVGGSLRAMLGVGRRRGRAEGEAGGEHRVHTPTTQQKAVGALGNQTHLTGCVTTSQTPYEQQKMPEIRFSPSFPPFTAPLKEVNWS